MERVDAASVEGAYSEWTRDRNRAAFAAAGAAATSDTLARLWQVFGTAHLLLSQNEVKVLLGAEPPRAVDLFSLTPEGFEEFRQRWNIAVGGQPDE